MEKLRTISSPIFGKKTAFNHAICKQLKGKLVRIQYTDTEMQSEGILFLPQASDYTYVKILTRHGKILNVDSPQQIVRVAPIDWDVMFKEDDATIAAI